MSAPVRSARLVARIAVLAGAVSVAACAMVNSQLIDDGPGGRCVSEAGFYHLPKTHLEVEVQRKSVDKTKNEEKAIVGIDAWHQLQVRQVRIADRRRGYCLDYLRSVTAEENISIKKYKAQPVLGLVTSDSTDRSFEIAQMLVRTIFTAVSGNPNFTTNSQVRNFGDGTSPVVTMVRADYDPFDPERSAVINHTLREFGFCLILEHYTANLDALTVDGYCDQPERGHRGSPQQRLQYRHKGPGSLKDGGATAVVAAAPRADDPTISERGLFYRPRISYQLYVFVKPNLQARGGWKLTSMHPVSMENIAPILSVGLDRTAFAQRKTTLVFDEGMLKDACHYQGSELVAVSKLPVLVAESVVALPANILQVRIDQTKGMQQLIQAQDEALKTQTKYLARLKELPDASSLTAGNPSAATAGPPKGFTTFTPEATAKASIDFKVGANSPCGGVDINAPRRLEHLLNGKAP